MRSKASLFLMEQLIMVLVFALAAALCLRCLPGRRKFLSNQPAGMKR